MNFGGGRRHRAWFGVVAVGLTAPLIGVSSAGAAGPQVKEAKYGFTMTLPNSWKTVPLNGTDVKSLLDTATHDNPSMTSALTAQVKAAASQGIKVFAIGPESNGSVPNVNIIVTSGAGAPTGNAFPAAAVVQAKLSLTNVGATKVKAAVVKNQMGSTAEVLYELHLSTGTSEGAQVYVLHKSRVVILTVTTSSSAQSQATARSIVKGWKWT